jgi:uncharacterized protein YjiS (DUF1127 family)
MSQTYVTHQTYSFVKCQIHAYLWVSSKGDLIMFARLFALMQLRRSTAFLLEREDDHLLDDIGLTRAELLAMRRGETRVDAHAKALRFHSTPTPRGLPVGASA